MKTNTISFYSIAGILLLTVMFGACKKFAVLDNADTKPVSAGQNLSNKTLWDFVSEGNFHENDLTAIGLYGKALERAGLKDFASAPGDHTFIIPSDKAILTFLNSIGYQTVDEVPPVILKNFLTQDIINTRIHSFDLPKNESTTYTTLSGDSLYLYRRANTADEYVLLVNFSPLLSSPSTEVRTQNIDLKNGVGHVVDVFTYYKPKISNADPIDTSKVNVDTDTSYVLQDAYVTYGTGAKKNFNTNDMYMKLNSNPNATRRALAQYGIKQPSFSGRIGSAKVVVYISRVDGDASISLFKDQYIQWDENTLTANNSPENGTTPLGGFSLPQYGSNNAYYATDITPYYEEALSSNENYINVGFATSDNALVSFRSKEFNDGANRSFILLSSPPKTILIAGLNGTLNVDTKSGFGVVTKKELSLKGTPDQNISYVLQTIPASGYLIRNGIPLKVNDSFTQQEIAKGAVKYLVNTTASTDSFSVEAKDFQGGFYNDIITVNVSIK